MGKIGSAIIDFTEAVYDLELSEGDWLPTLLRRGLPVLDQGLGVAGYEYGLPPDGGDVELLNLNVASGPEDFAERHMQALSTTDPEVLRAQLFGGCATTGSENALATNRPQDLEHYLSYVDYCKDVLYLTAMDRKGAGVAIVAPLKKVTTLSAHEAQRWQMLAAHVEAGHRLRRGLSDIQAGEGSGLPIGAEAVLDPTNLRVTDAIGPAQQSSATQKLREAALSVDRARGKMRKDDPEQALAIWKALVRGRWSIVDWFDTDGRRYVLGVPNSPSVSDPRGLTERERQIVVEAIMGHTNKMTAYRLGLSKSRVSSVLRSAMRKLGVQTRAQLVERLREFQTLH